MIRAAVPYLSFEGDADEAMALYQKALGAEIVSAMKWSDMPGDDAPKAEGIMHAELKIGEATVMLCDLPPEMQGEGNTRITVMLQFDAPDAVDRAFAALVDGGRVMMAVGDTFWGARYGFCIDRFGIGWQLNCQLSADRAG